MTKQVDRTNWSYKQISSEIKVLKSTSHLKLLSNKRLTFFLHSFFFTAFLSKSEKIIFLNVFVLVFLSVRKRNIPHVINANCLFSFLDIYGSNPKDSESYALWFMHSFWYGNDRRGVLRVFQKPDNINNTVSLSDLWKIKAYLFD